MDLDVARDVWTRDVIPGHIDNAEGLVGQGGESVGKEVEVVGAAAWAFVYDLGSMLAFCVL